MKSAVMTFSTGQHSGTTSRTSTLSLLKTLARGLYQPQRTVKCVSAVCVRSGHFRTPSRDESVIKGTRGPRLKNRDSTATRQSTFMDYIPPLD